MKKILITSFHPMISRNILAGGVLRRLADAPDVSVVLVVPEYKVSYFTERYGGEHITIEGVPLYRASKTWRGLLFKRLAIYLFHTRSASLRKRYELYLSRRLIRYAVEMCLGFVGRFELIRRFVRFLDARFSPRDLFTPILRKHSPTLVFGTDVQNENDVSLLEDARRLGMTTVGMVRSWDNLSLRFLRFFPDYLVVGSREVAREADYLHRFPKSRIIVTGNPHYDRYVAGPTKSREEFLRGFGLSGREKLILYAPVSDALIRKNDMDEHVLNILNGLPTEVVVRFPPEKKVTLSPMFRKGPRMAFDLPGQAFKEGETGDREIRSEDDENLLHELSYADLVITGPTSITIDAALLDKPVVAVDFYPTPRHFFETVWRYEDDHIWKLRLTGGVFFAHDRESFLRAIHRYLTDPSLDRAGRNRIRDRWFSHADGKAGERLADLILRLSERDKRKT